MPQSKLVLSKKEIQLLNDKSIWKTRQTLSHKLSEVLADIESEAKKKYEQRFTAWSGMYSWQSKISRGENYEGCPYLILDAPNSFSKDEILAVRSMIWYGHYASCFLLMSGAAFQKFLSTDFNKKLLQYKSEMYICIHNTPWNHQFIKDNMLPLSDFDKSMSDLPFLKLGLKKEISDIDGLHPFLISAYGIYFGLIS